MRKRSFTTFLAFFILIGLNLVVTFKYFGNAQRTASMNNILDEIDSSYNTEYAENSPKTGYQTAVVLSDNRVANLKSFFRKYNSPLYEHSEVIVKTADKYEFDYRLLPAIAMQESTLCKAIPINSHNCWGWGIYGNNVTRFESYDEAIETVSKGLKKYYIDKGRVTASQIMEVYTPSSNGSWARGVNSIFKLLD